MNHTLDPEEWCARKWRCGEAEFTIEIRKSYFVQVPGATAPFTFVA